MIGSLLSSLAGPVLGSAVGGLLGGGGSSQTVDNTPQIVKMFPDETEKLGGKALEIAQKELERPYEPLMPFVQATANSDPWNAQFDNPELIAYQNLKNSEFAQQPQENSTQSAAAAKAALDSLRNELIGRQFASGAAKPGSAEQAARAAIQRAGQMGGISNEDFATIGGLLTSDRRRAEGINSVTPEIAALFTDRIRSKPSGTPF